MQKVERDILVVNHNIKIATERFLDENPWAYMFDPAEKLEDIKVWE